VAHDDISLDLKQIDQKKKVPFDPADESWGEESDEEQIADVKGELSRFSIAKENNNLRQGMQLPS